MDKKRNMKKILLALLMVGLAGCSFGENNQNNMQGGASALPEVRQDSPTLLWNEYALHAGARSQITPPEMSRGLAILNQSLEKTWQETQSNAAMHEAGAFVLSGLYEKYDGLWDAIKAEKLEQVEQKEAKNVGKEVAQSVWASRVSDGHADFEFYEEKEAVGRWNPTSPYYEDAMKPAWGKVKPFVLDSGDQFRSTPPPAVDSAQFAEEMEAVFVIGGEKSTKRRREETEIAFFWSDGVGTMTSPGHWAFIGIQEAAKQDWDEEEIVNMMTDLSLAMADAMIATWDAKYYYAYWRPEQAIAHFKEKTGEKTEKWKPLIENPPFPEYPSGHSAVGGAAAVVLGDYFGEDYAFATTMYGTSRKRSYKGFAEGAEEAAMSRIYGGIHYESGKEAGLVLGKKVGEYVLQKRGK